MANTKVSDMTAATDLTGAVIPIVQSSTNKKAAIALFNKPRIQTVTSSATVTADADANDAVHITAQAVGLTLANPTGTPVNEQMIVFRIKDNGTAQTIAFGSEFRAMGVTLPTTTVISKTMYIPCVRNTEDTKWDVINVIQQV